MRIKHKVELHGFRVVVNLFSAKSRVKFLKEISIARLKFYQPDSTVIFWWTNACDKEKLFCSIEGVL